MQPKLFLKSPMMLMGTTPAVKSPGGTNQWHSHPGSHIWIKARCKAKLKCPREEGLGAEHPTACGKRAARRTEHVSQDIQPQLVTGKELGEMRTEHKANSSTTVSSERQGTARAHGPSLLRKTPHALISLQGKNLFQPRLFVYSANFVA